MLAQIAEWAAPARVSVAYPGLWVRPDVYATHGHYLDCHLTIPTLERLGVGAMSRAAGRARRARSPRVDDYEAVTAPVFAWRDAVARDGRAGAALNGVATVRAWRALGGRRRSATAAREAARRTGVGGTGCRELRRRALAGALPARASPRSTAPGSGPCSADISTDELRRAGLRAMGEVAARLGLGDAYVVFGHTHRAGPLPGTTPARSGADAAGARLVNAGCWTYDADLPRPRRPARARTGRERACSWRMTVRPCSAGC